MQNRKKALVIVNPRSGRLKVGPQMFNIADYFTKNNIETTVYTTAGSGDAKRFAEQMAVEHDILVCRGGDGTLNEVINGLKLSGAAIPVGYIPAGTSNDFANTVGIPTKAKRAIDLIVNGTAYQHDLGAYGDNGYFVYTASFGIFTKASYATSQNAKNIFGYPAYLAAGIPELRHVKEYQLKITCDGRETEGKYIFGAVTNSLVVGGIIHYDRDIVDFNDGKFEFILAKKPATARG